MRRNLGELAAQIDESDARLLVRIGIVQSILNARAYCRNFDRLTASQQMALTQLVYQIGFNLQEFTEFLALINKDDCPCSTRQQAVRRSLCCARPLRVPLPERLTGSRCRSR